MTTVWSGLTTTVPVSMAPAANGNVYCVNGATRGFVVVGGTTAYPLGVTVAPTVVASTVTSPQYYYVSGARVIDGGENYYAPPTVTILGVSGARATLLADSVADITITTSATTHTVAPSIGISGFQSVGATAQAIVQGSVVAVNVAGLVMWPFGNPPTLTFAALTGVTELRPAAGRAVLRAATNGGYVPMTSVVIEDPGLYEWHGATLASGASPVAVTASTTGAITAGGVYKSTLTPVLSGTVQSVTITSGGTNYSAAPQVRLSPDGPALSGSGAVATAYLNGVTSVSEVELVSGGDGYSGRVAVAFQSTPAAAVAELQPRLSGKYLLGWRYVASDGTPGDLCPLVTVDCKEKASSFAWNLGAVTMTDGSPSRVARVELWRTTADQAITLYRVASLTAAQVTALAPTNLFTEGMTDEELVNIERDTTINGAESKYQELAILTADGLPNAYRFGVPPSRMSCVALFADRAWYAVDSTGAEPNTIYFSGLQEYDSVAAENQIVLQNAGQEADAITALMPMNGALYVGQRRAIMRLTFGDEPLLSASAAQAAQRGMLNDRCWDQFDGVAYAVDFDGLYAFDGGSVQSLSDAVSTYWTDPLIDFSKSTWFFVRVDSAERVARLYFSAIGQAGNYPLSAICYSLTTKAWWLEQYAQPVSCGVRAKRSGRQVELLGGSGALLRPGTGYTDCGASIPYKLRTGNMPLNNDPKRSVRVLYSPTAESHALGTRLYYNGTSVARPFGVACDRGDGYVTTTGSTEATLDLAGSRSALGTASGFAQLSLAGRLDDRSAGADRHLAVEFAGTQSTVPVVLHSVSVEGVG